MVREYQGLVYTVCYQLVQDADTAQDLAQEAFLAAWRAADRCPAGSEKQWLARIAANKAKDHLRSGWARKMSTPGDEVLALADLGQEALQQKILALREPYKTPCRLCLLEGYTPAEAARLCRRPEKTLNAQLWRAKKMLRAQIEQEREQERRTEDGTV